MTNEELKTLVIWATGDDTGISSKAIARFMLGVEPTGWGFRPPSDASDRGRCIRLLNLIPSLWDRLDEMASIPSTKMTVYRNGNVEIVEEGWKEQIPLIKLEANRI